MKKCGIIISIITLAVLSTSSIAFATTQSDLSISPHNAKAGNTVIVNGGGFKPGANVSTNFDGSGIKDLTADQSGDISFSYQLPSRLSGGVHSFTAEGDSASKLIVNAYYPEYDKHVAIGSFENKVVIKGEKVVPTTTTTIVVEGKKVVPTPVESSGEELPFTGGLPLFLGMGVGTLLTAVGYRMRRK
jgi:hypothetical protein